MKILPSKKLSRRSYTKPLKPSFEQLERRQLLAADWQNPLLYSDVNDDGDVAPTDVLLIIN